MNPSSFFESNKANSLTQESGWHAQNTVDRELIEAKMASTEALFAVDSVGAFEFTDAVRPGKHSTIPLQQGYRRELFRSRSRNMELPMILAAATKRCSLTCF